MRRRHPVDIVAPPRLELEKNLSQSFERHFIAALFVEGLAYLMILTVDAPKIAKSEEYIARP
jgi:hypothetical protein